MKLLILVALQLVVTAVAFGIAPTMLTVPSRLSSTMTSLDMSALSGASGEFSRESDILSTLGCLEGPSICWGPEGTLMGKRELDIKEYDNFDGFKNALDQADLTKLLRGKGPFTVLAPVNTAIDVFPGILSEDVLKYHIILGDIYSDELQGRYETLSGDFVTCRHEFRKTYVDDALIGQQDNHTGGTRYPTDIICENGIIHATKQVLVPGYKAPGAEEQLNARRPG